MSKSQRGWGPRVRQRVNSPFYCLSVLFGTSVDCVTPTLNGEEDLISSMYPFDCLSLLEVPTQTHPEIMFYQLVGQPSAQSG